MKIQRIPFIRNYRVFRNFAWGGDLPDFGRFNLIYGWNGTGKTTLSTLFRHLQTKQNIAEGDVQFLIDNHPLDGKAIDSVALPQVRVFNRDTVKRSIFEIPNEQLPPIYFFGEDSAEKQKQIEALKRDAEDAAREQSSLEEKYRAASADLETFCTDRAREIKNLLTTPGGGAYNTYDARRFKETIADVLARVPQGQPLTDDERQRYLATKEGMPKEKIQAISVDFLDFDAFSRRAKRFLSTTVLSRALAELAADPLVASWVNQGLELHSGERKTDTCRFCGQPLQPERLDALNGRFNDEFAAHQSDLADLEFDLTAAKNALQEIKVPNKGLVYLHLAKEYEASANLLDQELAEACKYIGALIGAVKAKKDNPFTALELSPFLPPSNPADKFKDALDKVNIIIGDHNKHTENLPKEVGAARRALERDEVLRAVERHQHRQQSVNDAQQALQNAKGKERRIREDITELEKHVRQHQRPAEELNKEMAAYLGTDELSFKVQEAGYTITRQGWPAMNLSESERTALAFMYFLKSLGDTGFDLQHGVVVVDDPVSSLDANSLFCAFGFMKARTRDAGQVFVLTHNFTFFREVRNWFHYLNRRKGNDPERQPAHFYMLNKAYDGGQRSSHLARLDSFLHEYASEYQYLFKRIFDEANRQTLPVPLASYYDFPNMARRLLEGFLAFKLPGLPAENLFKKLEEVKFDDAKKTRLIRFLQTYSHSNEVDELEHDISVLSETPAILKDLMALIQQEDAKHYEGMVSRLDPSVGGTGVGTVAVS